MQSKSVWQITHLINHRTQEKLGIAKRFFSDCSLSRNAQYTMTLIREQSSFYNALAFLRLISFWSVKGWKMYYDMMNFWSTWQIFWYRQKEFRVTITHDAMVTSPDRDPPPPIPSPTPTLAPVPSPDTPLGIFKLIQIRPYCTGLVPPSSDMFTTKSGLWISGWLVFDWNAFLSHIDSGKSLWL